MDIYSFSEFDEEAVRRIREIDEKRHTECQDVDNKKDKSTKLMFEQMLRGLYLTVMNPNI